MKFWTNEFRDKTNGRVTVNYTGHRVRRRRQLDDRPARRLRLLRRPDEPEAARPSPSPRAGRSSTSRSSSGPWSRCTTCRASRQPLTFTGPVLADIFIGKVTKWNDPKLAALNPGREPAGPRHPAGLPVRRRAARRSSSPTTCRRSARSSRPQVGASNDAALAGAASGSSSRRATASPGTSAAPPARSGTSSSTYALDTKAQYGAVRNKAGKHVRADLASITAAAEATLDVKQTAEPYSLHELTYNLTDAPGDGSYPIAGMSFAVLYQKQDRPEGPGRGRVPEVGRHPRGAGDRQEAELRPAARAAPEEGPGEAGDGRGPVDRER